MNASKLQHGMNTRQLINKLIKAENLSKSSNSVVYIKLSDSLVLLDHVSFTQCKKHEPYYVTLCHSEYTKTKMVDDTESDSLKKTNMEEFKNGMQNSPPVNFMFGFLSGMLITSFLFVLVLWAARGA